MVGREMTATFPPRNAKIGEVALELKNLTGNGVKNISFQARRGEILGISGLVGAGRTEIMKVVFGAEKAQWGEIYVNGKKADIRSPKDAMHKYGICLIPEDRKQGGLLPGRDDLLESGLQRGGEDFSCRCGRSEKRSGNCEILWRGHAHQSAESGCDQGWNTVRR